MPWLSSTLSQVSDGQAAWDQFVSGVQQTFESNAAMVPVIVVVLVVAIVIWLDFRVARIIVGKGGKRTDTKRKPARRS